MRVRRRRADSEAAADVSRSLIPRHPVRWFVIGLLLAAPLYVAVTYVQVWMASRQDDRATSDAIVVLGAAQYDGKPSPVLRDRLDHAFELYKEKVAPRVVLTGSKRPGDRYTEAYTGMTYLQGKGVPTEDLVVISTGTSSFESLAAAGRELHKEHLNRVTLVSDRYHSKRLAGIAEEVGLDARVSPTDGAAPSSRLIRETLMVGFGRLVGYRRATSWFSS